VDPFTGASSYSTSSSNTQSQVDVNFVRPGDKHFPVSSYRTFDTCDAKKVLEKMKWVKKCSLRCNLSNPFLISGSSITS